MKNLSYFCFLMVVLLAPSLGAHAIPPNDLCANAELVPANGPFPFMSTVIDVATATGTGDPTLYCNPWGNLGVWYTFTPAQTDTFTLSACSAETQTTLEQIVMSVFTSNSGCAGPFSLVQCAQYGCDAASQGTKVRGVKLQGGTQYYILVERQSFLAPAPGKSTLQLRISKTFPQNPNPPANDFCGNATAIPASGPFPHFTNPVSMLNATDVADFSDHGCARYTHHVIWYTFTPAQTGNYTISSCANETATNLNKDMLLIFTSANGCQGPFSTIPGGCGTSACGDLQRFSALHLTAGTTYYLRYSSRSAGIQPGNDTVQLMVNKEIPPANNLASGAIPLSLNVPVQGNNEFASNNYHEYGGIHYRFYDAQSFLLDTLAEGRDMVYQFVAPQTSTYAFRVSPLGQPSFEVFLCSSMPQGAGVYTMRNHCFLASNRTFDVEELENVSLTVGQVVYVVVDQVTASNPGAFELEVINTTFETEPNNSFAQAEVLSLPMHEPHGFNLLQTPGKDADYFAIQNTTVNSRLFAMVDAAAASGHDINTRLYDPSETILERDEDCAADTFGRFSSLIGGSLLPNPGTHYLTYRYATGLFTQSSTFRLYATLQPPIAMATIETENNDSPANANSNINNYFRGAISTGADIDIYSFSAQAGDLVYLGLDGDPLRNQTPFNGALDLLDGNGNLIFGVDDTMGVSTTQSSPAEGLAYRIRQGGTYYARIRSGSTGHSPTGDYLLSIDIMTSSIGTTLDNQRLTLEAKAEGLNKNLLTWHLQDAAEIEWVEVYRADNSGKFERIANIHNPLDYSWTDHSTTSNYYQYRIEGHLADGRMLQSGIVEVHTPFMIPTQVWPNPFSDLLFIHQKEAKAIITIYDLQGKIVFVQALPARTHPGKVMLSVGHLPDGIYILECSGGGERLQKRLIKQ